jgi:Ca2+-dependent lipid-binding protein
VLSLYDYNDHRNNTLMGAATFELGELLDDATQEGLSRNLLKDGKDRGELKFDVSFYPVLAPKDGGGVEEIPDTSTLIFFVLPLFDSILHRCRYRPTCSSPGQGP